jgi:hypothetical protein
VKAFEVFVNGQRLCRAGIGDDGVLSVVLNWVGGKPPRTADGSFDFHILGINSATTEHVHWPSPEIAVGDEITIKILEADSVVPEPQRNRSQIVQSSQNESLEGFTYHVRGKLIDKASRLPMAGYSIIAESGIRDESLSLCLEGIQTGHHPTEIDGFFQATFYTRGASSHKHENAPILDMVEVHIEFSPGQWRCREVAVRPEHVVGMKDHEVWLDLGQIDVDYAAFREPIGWEEE